MQVDMYRLEEKSKENTKTPVNLGCHHYTCSMSNKVVTKFGSLK